MGRIPGIDAHQAAVVPTARGETVLVVDDSPQVRSIAARSLRAQGYLVLEAPGAAIF